MGLYELCQPDTPSVHMGLYELCQLHTSIVEMGLCELVRPIHPFHKWVYMNLFLIHKWFKFFNDLVDIGL